ncbi:outer membrane protein [Pontibaca methylaminivorans]|uniref:outer membrane protein n=1 Tax=Pontibaca methylaminivorans TaxID=515897 RepID=UPI002FDAFAB8
MKHLRYAAAIPALLLAAPAFAGNLEEPVVEPVIAAPVEVQPISDWTGFYLGAQAGYGDNSKTSAVGLAPGDRLSPEGGFAGIHGGYLYDLGQWVVGGELDYDRTNISDDGGPAGKMKLKNMARAKALVGYDLGDGLVYGTVGAFRGELRDNAAGWLGTPDEKHTDNGWLAGLGYKHKFTENWIGGVEALYHKKSDFDDTGFDMKLTTISARISYKF